MSVIGIILLVAFVIICILLVCLVLLQNEEGNGLGGLFGGASTTFGSRSGNVLTKTTYVLVTLFFVCAFALALINKKPTVTITQEESTEVVESEGSFWETDSSATQEGSIEEAVVENNLTDSQEASTEEVPVEESTTVAE